MLICNICNDPHFLLHEIHIIIMTFALSIFHFYFIRPEPTFSQRHLCYHSTCTLNHLWINLIFGLIFSTHRGCMDRLFGLIFWHSRWRSDVLSSVGQAVLLFFGGYLNRPLKQFLIQKPLFFMQFWPLKCHFYSK